MPRKLLVLSMSSACSFSLYLLRHMHVLSTYYMPDFRMGAGASKTNRTQTMPSRAQSLMPRCKDALPGPDKKCFLDRRQEASFSAVNNLFKNLLCLLGLCVSLSGFNQSQRAASFQLPFHLPGNHSFPPSHPEKKLPKRRT